MLVFISQKKTDKQVNTWEIVIELLVVQEVHTINRYFTRGQEVKFYMVSNILSNHFGILDYGPTDFKVVAPN